MLRYTTDRARPGLVALYDIWPGNGAGLFLQPRNLHGHSVSIHTHTHFTGQRRTKLDILVARFWSHLLLLS